MMFILKKVIAPFILPPGIFILMIVGMGLVLTFSRRWRIGLINLAIGLSLWALCLGPVANFLMRGLEAEFSIPSDPIGDVVILLGGGIVDRVPDLTGRSAPSPMMMGRVVTAARLYQRLKLPVIVSGGRLFDDGGAVEAPVIKRFLVDLGIPEKMIITEDRAQDTAQNARLTAAICHQHGYRQPILLTAAYHLKRARMAFESAGMAVTPFPAYFLGARDVPHTWRQWLPHAGTLYISASALHEYVGILYYRMVE
ncbi:hypothetical protein DSCO28_48920 [Desulfosarcina ovata subsp. sediminis]|uniref:DUF218 domain-containing protein n=1 Tax=Desulfosarcina ovata subsp. sediminis TaxID=885957 RepID=A0A5K7ZVY7_9BACT|nr:YdcF family protein [Desulfosarcina ovata]BBO84326.1 hypothetical protein DSCO28_48920 [Desulfosarcina ovata subsp. sediminis]